VIRKFLKSTIAGFVCGTVFMGFVAAPSMAEQDEAKEGPLETAMPSVVVVKAEDRTGAAFLCISNDWVVTSLHVVLGTTEISVRVDDEEEIPVDGYCLADETQDLVLLHLEKPLDRKPLKLRADLPAVGTEIFAIGNPHDLGNSVSKGIVSGIRRGKQLKKIAKDPMSQIILQDDEQWVQFDAPIQPGNSGGPIVDRSGEVVGVVSRGLMHQDINFASPVVALAQLSPQSLDPSSTV
jgi:serine protease Do